MDPSPDALIERLRAKPSRDDWDQLFRLYLPLLHFLARKVYCARDPDDLVQDVVVRVMEKLQTFTPRRSHDFSRWVSKLLINRLRDLCRRARARHRRGSSTGLASVAAPAEREDLATLEERAVVAQRAWRLVETDCTPATCKAFWECVVEGHPAAQVAAELGMSADSIYAAKSRIMRRLKSELAGR